MIINYSCKSPTDDFETLSGFDKTILLDARQIPLDKTILRPSKVIVSEKAIVIFDDVEDGDLFKVFDLKNYKSFLSFGRKGNGPDELKSVMGNLIQKTNQGFEVYDIDKIYEYIFQNDSIYLSNTRQLPLLGGIYNGVLQINDSIIIADNFMGSKDDFEHIVINQQSGEIIKGFGTYPNYKLKSKEVGVKELAFMKSLVSNQSKERIAVFYSNFNRIKIYDFEFNKLRDIVIMSNNTKTYNPKNRKENIVYNVLPVATDKYIFSLNIGMSKKEYFGNLNSAKPYINVWDWEGNPIARLKLDRAIAAFDVSSDNQKIYGTSPIKMSEILCFDIPKLTTKSILVNHQIEDFNANSNVIKVFEGWKLVEFNNKQTSTFTKDRFIHKRIIFINEGSQVEESGTLMYTWISKEDGHEVDLQEYFVNTFEARFKDEKDYCSQVIHYQGVDLYHVSFLLDFVDPKEGTISMVPFSKYLVGHKGEIVEISYNSDKDFELFKKDFEILTKSYVSSINDL